MRRRTLDFVNDYDRILEMQRLSWVINFPDVHFSEDAFRASLRSADRRHEVHVYEAGADEIVGWLWLSVADRRGSAHIRHVQVSQAHWGRRLARRILRDAIQLCECKGCLELTLNVTKANQRVMALYCGLGFVRIRDEGDRQLMSLDLTSENQHN